MERAMVTMPTEHDDVPWFPECLRRIVESPDLCRRSWSYVVLEEIVGDTAELISWPWPLADQNGRLFWPPGDETHEAQAAVPRALLEVQLYTANGIERRPRPGDTFACQRGGPGWGQDDPVDDLRVLFPGEVLDVSADAREAAKLAYQGALAAVEHGESDDLRLERAREERSDRTAPVLHIPSPDSVVDAP
jgi:hypothetical protein